ncbi:hypothetical protein ACA910_004347 [Epithemia clementina (nom. ined.)]
MSAVNRPLQFATMRYRYFYCAVFVAVTLVELVPQSCSFTINSHHPQSRIAGGKTCLPAATVVPSAGLQLHGIDERSPIHTTTTTRPNHHHYPGGFLTSSSLFASTVLPPPAHHMDWLRSQDEQERLMARRQKHGEHQLQQQKQNQKQPFVPQLCTSPKCGVVPMSTLFSNVTTALSAKESWAACFTTVEGLRDTFGRNRNVVWGDLDASTTRRLYKTLLPRALLELYHCQGVSSVDLAPMAYRARVAAKKYARERSVLPTRLAAAVFDGFRQFCKYGTFQATGMSYPQLWEKYATQIIQEEDFNENEQDLTSRICYRILQKSCETNKKIDSMFMPDQAHDLQEITRKLEQDVYDLLDSKAEDRSKWAIRRYKILRALLRIRRQMEGLTYCESKDDDLAMQAVIQDAMVDGCKN